MSKEAFGRMIAPFIRDGIPFLAYWHPAGMGLIRLDEVQVPRRPPCETHCKETHADLKPHQLGKRGRQTWEKNLARLRKQTWGRVVTVEFDGKELKTDGGFEP